MLPLRPLKSVRAKSKSLKNCEPPDLTSQLKIAEKVENVAGLCGTMNVTAEISSALNASVKETKGRPMSIQPVELRFWSTEDRYDRVPGPTGMEFDSLVHRTDGTETLEPPETTSFPRLMGASFLLEKFGEIYFATSRRNHNAMARSEHPFCTLKNQTSLPIASDREHGEKETDVPAEGQFKRTAPLNASYNEHDELLLWSNEPRRCKGGEPSSQVRFGEVYHDLCNTSDSSGQKRKFSDASSANKEFPNFDKTKRGIKKMRGKEIDDHRGGNRKEGNYE
ncbi:hypothetical protein RUM44_006381 [Polyplax serrata]|uniref:Uncharacterized protein n=1 Tax=Polyplax serrata TaxID=468196 RepID=A0ABR1AHY2_POLSC